MGSSVGFLLESCRKVDKRKLDFLFAMYLLVIMRSLFFLPHQLQQQSDRQWQTAAFCVSSSNGNSIIANSKL
jgi:hypothetical protein